ncbi:hypothetical protein [Nostoc sp. 'Peltigera membranacea cyanobiont' 213]|nr:hypothetical protein [Nostoc sp. 'Peltigera membranacea cyanobiont' 213]
MLFHLLIDIWFTKPLDFDEFLAMLACLAIYQQPSSANGLPSATAIA